MWRGILGSSLAGQGKQMGSLLRLKSVRKNGNNDSRNGKKALGGHSSHADHCFATILHEKQAKLDSLLCYYLILYFFLY